MRCGPGGTRRREPGARPCQGRAYALLEPSGCGRTTLLDIISGLVIPLRGRPPTRRRNIARVFQFPVVHDTMTVAENLGFPLRNRGMDRRKVAARMGEAAAMFGLAPRLRRRARALTADAKQRISPGRGLVRPGVAA